MGSNGFWVGVALAHDDARRAKARRNAKKVKAIRVPRRARVTPADLAGSTFRETCKGVLGLLIIAVGVWLWLR
jgi:hypothetical protein